MVKICTVRGCNNEWYPGSNIIYHSLPKTIAQRNVWLSKVPLKNNLYECAKICSAHFKQSDYSSPEHLKETAIPNLLIEGIPSFKNEDEFLLLHEACRICLAMDRKQFKFNENHLCDYYEELMGLSAHDENKLPQKVCWECAHKLISYKQFKLKALRSQEFMLELLKAFENTTQNTSTSIEQVKDELRSRLAVRFIDTDRADYCIVEDEAHTSKLDSNSDEKSIDDIEIHQVVVTECCLKEEVPSDTEYIDENKPIINYVEESKSKTIHKIEKRKVRINLQESREFSDTEHVKEKSIVSDVIREKKTKAVRKIDKKTKKVKEKLSEDLFEVINLTRSEQLKEIESRKESSNFKYCEFKCYDCCKGFCYEDSYKLHMTRHTDQAGPFECDVCKLRFQSQSKFGCHRRLHTQKFSCKQCPFVTTRRHAAKRHEQYHNGKKYECPHCPKQFLKVTTYMSHVRIQHPSDFVCELCGYSFIGAKGLAQHKNLKHRFDQLTVAEDGPKCVPCEVTFACKEALERHLTVSPQHIDPDTPRRQRGRPRGYEVVNKIKGKRRCIVKKSKSNKCGPDEPISCEQCDAQLPNSSSYHRHFRLMHPDKNRTNYPTVKASCMCEICGKMFKAFALLEDHRYSHGEAKQFKCSVCDKRFQRRYRLSAHQRTHAAPRESHPCAVCDKRFSSAGNVARHMFIHTGFKPFKCEMCGKCFLYQSEKRAHISYVHMKKPWPKRNRGKRKNNTMQEQMSPSQTDQMDTDIE